MESKAGQTVCLQIQKTKAFKNQVSNFIVTLDNSPLYCAMMYRVITIKNAFQILKKVWRSTQKL